MFKCMSFTKCNRHVETIDKRHQNLTSFPDDVIRYYRTLEELLLDSNQLHELPKGFYKLTQLRKLDISDNEIEKLSPEIGNFTNLIEFCCNRNDIQEIPDSIKYCKNIQVLDLSNNPLQCLPTSLTQLKALVELTLNDLSLSSLPDDIGNLVNLKSLQSRDNLLKYIPDSLCNLSKLELLDLGSNEIEEIPSAIGNLHSMKEFWLDLNQLKTLPVEIGLLKRLQYLELSENMLETLPDEISGCVSLTDLHLTQNSIEFIPSSIGQLDSLNILKLEQNQLVVLTPSIGKCRNLTELVLTENLLSEIPNSIGNLKLLANLNLDRNRLTNLPNEICECDSLNLLALRDNQLHFLPEKLGKLQKLRVLDVAGNKLSYLPYSLAEANINAIWLAENQAAGQIKLQPEFDEELQKDILTCYLLPQQNYHTPSMENLLQGSVNTEFQSQNGAINDTSNDKQVTKFSESVRFAAESEAEDKPSHFIRTNTPHPKDLQKKKDQLKTKSGTQITTNELESSEKQINFKVDDEGKTNDIVESENVESVEEKNSGDDKVGDANNEEQEISNSSSNISASNSFQEKHVGFNVNGDEDPNSSFRLRRHDTPHYLKGARINNKPQIGQNEILTRYTSTAVKTTQSNSNSYSNEKIDENNLKNEVLKKNIMLSIKIQRNTEKTLGISIVTGTNPKNEDDDEDDDSSGVFVTKLLPGGLASKSGLCVGDQILNVNGIDLNDLSHDDVVKLLNGKNLNLIILQELDLNKILFIDLSNINDSTNCSLNINREKDSQNFLIVDVPDYLSQFGLKTQDIILQINGKNIDLMETSQFSDYFICLNDDETEFCIENFKLIKNLTIYRPVTKDLVNTNGNSANGNTAEGELNTKIQNKEASPINSSTPLKTKSIQESQNKGMEIEEIKIIKINGAMGLSIVGGGSVPCHPFGVNEPGIFISKIAPDGAASKTNLRIGDRILRVNNVDIIGASHDETVDELKRFTTQVTLTVRHDPQPSGLMEILLIKSQIEETLGIRIHGGIENKSANPFDPTDEGIFVIDVIPDTIAYRDGRLQIGTRIIEVNGQSLLGVKLSEAQSFLVRPTDKISMVICDGFNKIKMNEIEIESKANNLPHFPHPPILENETLGVEELKNKPNNKTILNANYDNLRNIDSDDSMITSPEKSYNLSIRNRLTSNEAMKQAAFNATEKNISTIIKQKNTVTSMSEICERPTVTNGKPDANDSVRSFKDKMKFFETVKEREPSTKQRSKFSYLQEHEIQNIKQEEEKKLQNLSQDEIIIRSRIEIGDDITSHKDYATFFSNSIDGYDALNGNEISLKK